MPRALFGSQNVADTATAVQLFTDEGGIFAATFKARAGNNGSIYIGSNSATKSSGFELLPGDREDRAYHPVSIKANLFWVWGADSGDRLDWEVLRDN